MIKSSSIKKLNENCIANLISEELSEKGFKYLKSKQIFKQTKKGFVQIISITNPHNPLEYIEEQDIIILKFELIFSVENPKFDVWVEDKVKERSYFRHQIRKFEFFIELNFSSLEKDDFFSPSESQIFKNNVTSSLSYQNEENWESIKSLPFKLDKFTLELDRVSDYQILFDERSNSYSKDYTRLLVYAKLFDQAQQSYKITSEKYILLINEKLKSNIQEAKRDIQNFEKHIKEVEILLNLIIENPFSRDIQLKTSKDTKIKLSQSLGYSEILRYDTKLIDIKSFDINDNGEIVALIEGRNIIKFDREGNILKLGELKFQEFFSNDIDYFEVKWNSTANCFTCNNYIIKNDSLVELKLGIKNNSKNKISPQITDLVYDSKKQQFLLLFTPNYKYSFFSKFNSEGELLETTKIDQFCLKINHFRKELISQNQDNSMSTLDYQGRIVNNYKFNNGNNSISLSPNGNEMILHSYSTKSQYYKLKDNSKNTLWAHPTYLKNYKENFYNDIHHNFGLTYCKFTPNGKYVIGGADHGKYVVWNTTKLERKELIPNENSYEIFNQFSTSISDNEKSIKYYKPYTVTHENQLLFINRGYSISNIYFIDNGKYIITQVGDSLLVWNEDFKNIGHLYGLEKTVMSKTSYLAYKNETELVIFKRIISFNNDFESSVFKEKKGINSNITVLDKIDNPTEKNIKKLEEKINEKTTTKEDGKRSFLSRLLRKKST